MRAGRPTRAGRAPVVAAPAMAAVPAMHEEVHQRTRQNEQERQGAEKMRLMLGDEIEASDSEQDVMFTDGDRASSIVLNCQHHRQHTTSYQIASE